MQDLIPVQSTLLQSYAFDSAAGVLAIRFVKSPFVHLFQNVEAEVAKAFAEAESIGKAFHATIKGKYPHTTVRADEDAQASEPGGAPDPAVVAITETKVYADGSSATGPGPLPDQSPEEQHAAAAQ
ncbi:MAG: KTSC domain-containing protein [Ramlibacter sp.]|nr:KTSC domain-containing protein [Ramlibacter sp.]